MFLCNKLTEFLPERQHRAGISQPGAALCLFWWLHRLSNYIAHRIRRFPHHIWRGVGIGAECEPCRVVTQGAGQGLHVHPILQGQRCEGMPLRYNYDKPEKPRISRVFGYQARFFILFQPEKSSREVVIS